MNFIILIRDISKIHYMNIIYNNSYSCAGMYDSLSPGMFFETKLNKLMIKKQKNFLARKRRLSPYR